MDKAYKSYVILSAVFILSVFLLSFSTLSVSALAVTRLNVTAGGVALPSNNIAISGSITNTTTSDVISPVNVTAVINSTVLQSSSITPANGTFLFNITAPSAMGSYNITIYTNHSSTLVKTLPVFVSNATTGSVTYTRSFPPFSRGTTFSMNITLKAASGSGFVTINNSYTPAVSVFLADGSNTSWTVTNDSAGTDVNGVVKFNVTIPSTASAGSYVILVDNGIITSVFEVGAGYRTAVNLLDQYDAVASDFAPGSTVNVLAKIRDNSGNPVTGATVNANITTPSGAISTMSLSAHPSSSGFYNNTFSSTSISGTYSVRITATISGTTVESSGSFNIKAFAPRIEPQKKFFMEWGGQGAFKPSSTVALNIISTNLTDGTTINWNTCTGADYTAFDLSLVNGTSANSSALSVSYATDPLFSGTNVCRVSFLPSLNISATYRLRVNVTVGGSTETAEGYFTVQKYFLKPTPVFSLGGSEDFMQTVAPGDNVTMDIKAYNTSDGQAILPGNFSVVTFNVTQLLPLEFMSGSTELTTFNQSSVVGSNPSTDPQILLQLPNTVFGPLLIQVQARVAGETITGSAFLVANYLQGFMSPQSAGVRMEGPGGGGMGEDRGGGPSGGSGAKCSGNQTFTGTVQDVKTGTAAQGATIIGIIQAREDESGKDVSSYLSIGGSTASDSSGSINANITYIPPVGYTFSGDYFVVLNVSYKGNTAGLPSFFQCKNLQIGSPQIKAVGTTESNSWQVSPTSGINITLSNVTNITGTLISNMSALQIPKIFNFNPSSGSMQILIPNNPAGTNATFITRWASDLGADGANIVSITIYPQNFTLNGIDLTQWPNGFFDLRPRVVSNIGTDTSFGGFQVTAFNAFTESFGFGQVSAGSSQTITVNVNTNVSNSSTYSDAAFQVSLGRPWEGELLNVTGVSATLLSDGWNHSANTGFERWQVTYTIPETTKKGGQMLNVKVFSKASDNSGNSVDIQLFQSVVKFSVLVPPQDTLGDNTNSPFDAWTSGAAWNASNMQSMDYGWNLTYINATYGLTSTSGTVCIKDRFNASRNSQQIVYDNGKILPASWGNVSILAMDAGTSGTYNLLVFNNSQGLLTFANTSVITQNTTLTNSINASGSMKIGVGGGASRNITVPTVGGGLYYVSGEFCGFHILANTTNTTFQSAPGAPLQTSGMGPQAINTEFVVPYTVLLAGQAQSDYTVDINGMGKQDNRGFGFESKMTGNSGSFITSGKNFSSTSAMTDAAGTAFVKLNVTNSGRFVAFWRANSTTDSDYGDMSTSTFIQIQRFRTYAGEINPSPSSQVKLYYNSTDGVLKDGAFPGLTYVYNGTYNERNTGKDFLNTMNTTEWWYFAFSNITSQIVFGNSTSVYSPQSLTSINSTISLGVSQGAPANTQLAIAEVIENNTINDTNTLKNITFHFYNDNQVGNSVNPSSTTANISVRVCAEDYTKPSGKPVVNATVNLSVTDWSTFPSTTKYLSMYKLSDNSTVTGSNPILTGPRGCAALWVGPGQLGTWPSANSGKPPMFIEGTLVQGSNTEFVYVADVFKS